MLKPLLITVILGIVVLGLFYGADISVKIISRANNETAKAFNITPVTYYSEQAETSLGSIAWIILLLLGGVLFVAGLHIRRR